jgi:hypothetical protein
VVIQVQKNHYRYSRLGSIACQALCWIGLACAASNAEPVTFPGQIKEVLAPNSKMRVFYVDPGENEDGIHLYSLRLEYPSGRVDTLDTFMRSAEVSWSLSGHDLFVNDFVGSNVAECMVVTPSSKGTKSQSITRILSRAHVREVSEHLKGDHVYVTCSNWNSPTEIHVEMRGDKFPDRFEHHFTYDLMSGTLAVSTPKN